MLEILISATMILTIAVLIITIILIVNLNKLSKVKNPITDGFEKSFQDLEKNLNNSIENQILKTTNNLNNNMTEKINKNNLDLTQNIHQAFNTNKASMDIAFDNFRKTIDAKIDDLILKTNKQMEEISKNIDNQLKEKLDSKLQKHFDEVEEKMSNLTKELTEFSTLQQSVGQLNKSFNSVKTRGNFGEYGLRVLLQNNLTEGTWFEQVAINKKKTKSSGGEEKDVNMRVDFAISIPNDSGENTLIPIDSKFPIENFNLYNDAETKIERENALKLLIRDIENEAKSINDKYINPPQTTDYALLFLPSEALYAAAAIEAGKLEEISRKHKVIVVGPITLISHLKVINYFNSMKSIANNVGQIRDAFVKIWDDYNIMVDKLVDSKVKAQTIEKSLDQSIRKASSAVDTISKLAKTTNIGLPDRTKKNAKKIKALEDAKSATEENNEDDE